MVKRKMHPLENELYAKVLIEIGRESPSIQELAKRVKKKISSVSEYLNELEEIECVKRTKNRNLFRNRKEVSINWSGLTKQYFNYLNTKLNLNINKKKIESYHNNKYLQELIKLTIRDHQKYYHNTRIISPINKLFEKMTMQIAYADTSFSDRILKSLKRSDARFYNFIQFTKLIKIKLTADYRKTYGKFLRGIVRSINAERTSKKNN